MSSARSGLCTPTHADVEVWTSSLKALQVYANESYSVGGDGYFGISGVYTTHDFVLEGANESIYSPPLYPAYWMPYRSSEVLIDELKESDLRGNPKYFPPSETFCADGFLGCRDHCSKSYACTLREEAGKECIVVAMMFPTYDQAFFQAVLSNLDVPAYFCFLGDTGMQNYVLDAQKNGSRALFYHYEPDMFHIQYKGLFDRVFLPRSDPTRVLLSTREFGENGYGNKTDNPVDVDFPSMQLMKYAGLRVKSLPIGALLAKLSISDLDISTLFTAYSSAKDDAAETDPYFRASCGWVRDNYATWSGWLDRLPLCTLQEYIINSVSGCENDSSVRAIEFQWETPNPADASLPYACDGGVTTLPATIRTSRSCDWIQQNPRTWSDWIDAKPACDTSFYDYSVSACDSAALRGVTYFWLLPNASDVLLSSECEGGAALPASVQINCEYMPASSPVFQVVTILAAMLTVLLLVAMVVVFLRREAPIIRRSQYEMLELILVGGIFTCGAAVAYGGRPTKLLCGLRPVLVSMGFTTIFGALVVKSLRVYRVFMRSAMKRVTVTLRMILKLLSFFYLVDVLIFVGWFSVDFPLPTVTTKEATEFRGSVDRITCNSSSFIFTALLIFWKAMLLFVGLYLSFLIRNVSVDFQESHWIFGSAVVVLVASVVILPLTYLVDLPAATYFVFLAGLLLFCTVLIMALMLLPKLMRLQESGGASTVITKTEVSTNSDENHPSVRRASSKYKVGPKTTQE
ncbi:hypothetical protein BBJ28_00025404, partial [Nothophytophthora sp. Chile5]